MLFKCVVGQQLIIKVFFRLSRFHHAVCLGPVTTAMSQLQIADVGGVASF